MNEEFVTIKIRQPDDVIPFTELLAELPSFRCHKPSCINDMRVGTLNKDSIPEMTTISTTAINVVALEDLEEFINQLNKYMGYVESQLKQRSLKHVLIEAIQTNKGRQIIEDLLKNSKFNYNYDMNIGTGEPDWKEYKIGDN